MLECWKSDPFKRPTFEFLAHMFEDFNITSQPQYMEWEVQPVTRYTPENLQLYKNQNSHKNQNIFIVSCASSSCITSSWYKKLKYITRDIEWTLGGLGSHFFWSPFLPFLCGLWLQYWTSLAFRQVFKVVLDSIFRAFPVQPQSNLRSFSNILKGQPRWGSSWE